MTPFLSAGFRDRFRGRSPDTGCSQRTPACARRGGTTSTERPSEALAVYVVAAALVPRSRSCGILLPTWSDAVVACRRPSSQKTVLRELRPVVASFCSSKEVLLRGKESGACLFFFPLLFSVDFWERARSSLPCSLPLSSTRPSGAPSCRLPAIEKPGSSLGPRSVVERCAFSDPRSHHATRGSLSVTDAGAPRQPLCTRPLTIGARRRNVQLPLLF